MLDGLITLTMLFEKAKSKVLSITSDRSIAVFLEICCGQSHLIANHVYSEEAKDTGVSITWGTYTDESFTGTWILVD